MPDTPTTQPTATVAGQSVALHVDGYPDVPNRWGSGSIRGAGLRIDYGSSVRPDARLAHLAGTWIRDDEDTGDPLDQYYDAPDGDTSHWPDWIAELTRKHTPPETGAEQPTTCWHLEILDGIWGSYGPIYNDRDEALARYRSDNEQRPTWNDPDRTPVQRRVVRETTTYTVEEA